MPTAEARQRTRLLALLRDHLAGRPRPAAEPDRLLWQWFAALCATRTSGLGPNPITYSEIEAYARLRRWSVEERHIDLIRALDQVWLENARSIPSGPPVAAPAPRHSQQPLTPEFFDAVF